MNNTYSETTKNRLLANGTHVLSGSAGGYMLASDMDHALLLPMLTIGADVAVKGIEEIVAPLSANMNLKEKLSFAFYNSCMKGLEGLTCAGIPGMLAYMAVNNS